MHDNYQEVLIVIIVGTFIFIVLTSIIVFISLFYQKKKFQHQQQMIQMEKQYSEELLKTQLETQEETFHQISEELHDNIGQLLSTSKLLMSFATKNLQHVPDTLQTAEETLGKAIQDLRSLSKSLNKEWLHQFNVIDNLKAEVERINSARTIQTQLHSSTNFLPLAAEAQVMLFRIIQEAVQNSIKHANPEAINIIIDFKDQEVTVKIEDNGKGFNAETVENTGVGLLNMQHRTKLLGGKIQWQPLQQKGTQVCIVLPVQPENI